MTHTLFVCSTCATVWKDGKPQGKSGGEFFLEELQQQFNAWELQAQFTLQTVKCLSACSRACAVAFAAENKYTYLFGDLPHQPETLPEVAAAVLDCAEIYYQKETGLMAWSERPEALKNGVISRIPPLPKLVAKS